MSDRVVIMSLWRNDSERSLKRRAGHLLLKSYPNRRYVWVVGDSDDDTASILRERAARSECEVEIIEHRTLVSGHSAEDRVRRASLSASVGFDNVKLDDDYWLIHESDIISPPDIVERFLATGKCPIAGWPTLGPTQIFYDIWAYRKDGQNFTNGPPYHPGHQPDRIYEVDSVGTCWMFEASALRRGLRCRTYGAVELCRGLKGFGHRIWVDPTIRVIQPVDLFESKKQPEEPAWAT